MSINSVVISGNAGRDPELVSTPSGTTILKFSIAVNERVKRGEEWEDYVNWFDCVVFGRRAEALSRIIRKGMKLAVSGRLRYQSWENKEGQRRSKVEVIAENVDLMQRRDGDGSGGAQSPQTGNYAQQQQYGPQSGSQAPTGYQDGYTRQQVAQITGGNVDYADNYAGDYGGYWE